MAAGRQPSPSSTWLTASSLESHGETKVGNKKNARSYRSPNTLLHCGSRTHLPSRRGILRIQGNKDNRLVSCMDYDNRSVLPADNSKHCGLGLDSFATNRSNNQSHKFSGRDHYDPKLDGHSNSRSASVPRGLWARKTVRKPGKTLSLSLRRKLRQAGRTNSSNYS